MKWKGVMKRLTPHIPIYHNPPNEFIRYVERYFHDGYGHGGIETVAIFLDKKKNQCETTAYINWNPDYTRLWSVVRKRLHQKGYLLHNNTREPMSSPEVIKPDYTGVYHLVWIGYDEIFNIILRYSVYNGWVNYTPDIITGKMIDTREPIKNAVGVKKLYGDL